MPYASKAQQRFFHSPSAKKAGLTETDIQHWDKVSKGLKLPERKGKTKYQRAFNKLKTAMSKMAK